MNFSRRNFIKLSGIAAVSTLGFAKTGLAQTNPDALLNQNADNFRNLIGSDFYFSTNELSIPGVLTKVAEFPNKTKGGECFLLEFQVRSKRAKQDTYQVFNTEIGNFDLFLTEGKNGKSRTLLATINRL